MQKQLQVHQWACTVMRVSLLQFLLSLMFIGFGYAKPTYAQNVLDKKISIEIENQSLRNTLSTIEKLTDARFMYHSQLISAEDRVSVSAKDKTLDEVLHLVLDAFQIDFEAAGNQIVLTRNDQAAQSVGKNADQGGTTPAFTVSGTVVDENQFPLPGVNVLLKGTTTGTSTDAEGHYTMSLENGEGTLVFSFIGYVSEEYAINNQLKIDVTLFPDINTLSEVVVVGYGEVKKRDLTGSVASVASEDIVKTPTHNAVESMQGRVPGMDIVRSSGTPGAGVTVTIRGNKSIAGRDELATRNMPLYVVDGYQMPQGSGISDLNVNDIESIDVLKDASATAIYGAMGANGVVIVTTKRGKEGKARVSYTGYYGVNKYAFPEARTKDDYIKLRKDAYRASEGWDTEPTLSDVFTDINELNAVNNNQWVNWVDKVKQDGVTQSHTISVSGGTEKTKIFTSAGYFNEQGMLRNDAYSRYNLRFNLDQTISNKVTMGVLSQVTYTIRDARKDPLSQALAIAPLGTPYDEFGDVVYHPLVGATSVSPLADEATDYTYADNTIRTNLLANGYVQYEPLPGLKFRSNFGSNLSFSRRGIFQSQYSLSRVGQSSSYASSTADFYRFLNWDNILTYDWKMGDHGFTVSAITSYLQSDADETAASGTGQFSDAQTFYALNGTTDSKTISSPYVGWKNMAYAGRLNYNYQGKYLLTASGRYDGASRLAAGHKWAFFPSVALGWNVIDEDFMKGLDFLTNLKLRASYGVSGNYSIDPYGTQSTLTPVTNMSFGEVQAITYQFSTYIGNAKLGWEKSATTDLGMDLSIIQNRVSTTIDVYKTITSDILMPRSLPTSTGVSSVYQNIAETENKGIEVSITSQNVRDGEFQWNSTVTFSSNREKITALIDGTDIINSEDNSFLQGHPITSFYTYKKLGIWQSDEADEAAKLTKNTADGESFVPGEIKLKDINGDGIISADSDRVYLGSSVPKFVLGIQNTFRYKGFDLSIFLLMRYGQMIDAEFLGRYNPSGTGNSPAMLKYWTPETPTNDMPMPSRNGVLSSYFGYQSLTYVDGSFFKVKNVNLGYTFPMDMTQRAGIRRVRLYVTGNNLYVKAKSHLIKHYDPERGGSESSPLSQSFIVGLNVDF